MSRQNRKRGGLRAPLRRMGIALAWIAPIALVATLIGSSRPGQDVPTRVTETCTDAGCHAEIVGRKVMHGPTAQKDCLACHEYAAPEGHLFRLKQPKSELCLSCHTLEHKSVLHQPVRDGNCLGCHDPHGSDHPMMMVADPAGDLCLTCHEQDYSEKMFVHGPVAIGACVVCHEPHSADNPKLLTKPGDKLCISCHSEKKATGIMARHQHKPMENGCTSCHDPHASDAEFQLNQDQPDLCFSCHKGQKSLAESSSVIHGPFGEKGGCTECHNPHFTQLPRLQNAAQPDLCLGCHDKSMEASNGTMLTDMKALLKDNPNHHGPIRKGMCTSCHQPHANNQFRLLMMEYPAAFYAPFKMENYDLCFSCHMPDLVQDQSGTGLTGFRDGDRNLHWLHVNKKKGRTCRACHEVHASKQPFHIRESVPFGDSDWLLKINYTQTETGGTCETGCHKKKEYNRKSAANPGE